MPTLKDVKAFWNTNPLYTGELKQKPGSREWFEAFDQLKTYIIRPDRLPLWIGKELIQGKRLLDVGCGPGYWHRATKDSDTQFYGIDISEVSVNLARQAASQFGARGHLFVGNAEFLAFQDKYFDHVICEGVIHHTPDTNKALNEIIRVLKIGGTATISVYYKNWLLRNSSLFKLCRATMNRLNISIKGRGRNKMKTANSVEDFIRMYDGADNPVGRGYTSQEFLNMLPPGVTVTGHYTYFSPLRAVSRLRYEALNRFLDTPLGLMICFCLKKTQ